MKSYLTAVFCCVRAILYPGSKIILASGNKKQAGNIITEKIVDLQRQSPALMREISEIKTQHDNICCVFKNGSIIRVTTSGDGARGMRGNVLVADEFRLIKEKDINFVLKQFLTAPRRPPFMGKEEYENYPRESNKELFLSSAFLKSHWSYNKFETTVKSMCEGKPSFACDIPYICSLDHDLLLKEKIEEDKQQIGQVAYDMEYCGLWFGESENSYFKSDEINNCRVLNTAFYPMTVSDYRDEKEKEKKRKQMPKMKGEIRIMGIDVAVMGGKNNDNSIYTLMRLIPNVNGFTREVVHMESYNGLDVEEQAMRIKRLFFEFKCDKIIIDYNGTGFAVLNELMKDTYDKIADVHYPSFAIYERNTKENELDVEMGKGGLPVIYAIKPTETSNNNCCVWLKNAFASRKIRLLIDESEKRTDYTKDKKFFTDPEYSALQIAPFIQTSQFVFETLNLVYEVRDKGNIAVREQGRNRKDRYSSLSYANYLAELIENEKYKKGKKRKSKFMFFYN